MRFFFKFVYSFIIYFIFINSSSSFIIFFYILWIYIFLALQMEAMMVFDLLPFSSKFMLFFLRNLA